MRRQAAIWWLVVVFLGTRGKENRADWKVHRLGWRLLVAGPGAGGGSLVDQVGAPWRRRPCLARGLLRGWGPKPRAARANPRAAPEKLEEKQHVSWSSSTFLGGIIRTTARQRRAAPFGAGCLPYSHRRGRRTAPVEAAFGAPRAFKATTDSPLHDLLRALRRRRRLQDPLGHSAASWDSGCRPSVVGAGQRGVCGPARGRNPRSRGYRGCCEGPVPLRRVRDRAPRPVLDLGYLPGSLRAPLLDAA